MTTYSLKVNIDSEHVRQLHDGQYKLCISMKVNGRNNVVLASSDISNQTVFQWTDQYRVFGVDSFQPGALVRESTNAIDIAGGYNAVIDASGNIDSPQGIPSGTEFRVENHYSKTIRTGVSLDFEGQFRPIYVGQELQVGDVETFAPTNNVTVFFSNRSQTGTMIVNVESPSLEVEFDDKHQSSVSYSGTWVRE